MKKILFGLLVLFAPCAYGQDPVGVQSTLKSVVEHAEVASLYRNRVDWDTLKLNIHDLTKHAEYIADLKPALNYLLRSLGDEHGRMFYQNQLFASYYSGELKAHQQSFQPDIYNDIQMGNVYKFHAETLENNIGYVRIVGLPTGDNQKMAGAIQDKVCALIEAGAENWIIDLRYNGGGNMHPMAEGLALIIGNGAVGGTRGLTEAESSSWRVENDHFYYDGYSIELEDHCQLPNKPKIAVLTSLYTASSGEALAVIFKGKEKTRFFGQKTLGMVTATDWTVIDDAIGLTISVSYYEDRNGNVYDEFVDVDVAMPFAREPLSDQDECVREAIEWLNRE
ncbi:S41 family peptidase [Flavilitoribacter nigricans]|nr:S41 family peptidase [Flavilitoribacter nigricans]